jgi:hypothetical protein
MDPEGSRSYLRRVGGLSLLAAAGLALILAAWAGGSASRLPGSPDRPWAGPFPVTAFPASTPGSFDRRSLDLALSRCRLIDSTSTVPVLAHGLLLWGRGPHRAEGIPGDRVIDRLLDHDEYVRAFKPHHPLLVRTRYGVRFAEQLDEIVGDERLGREAHVGQLISALAECGIPLDRPIRTPEGPATLKDVLDDLIANFTLDNELDWSLMALTLYLPPAKGWRNKFGAEFTFDQLASRFLERPLGEGSPCAGTHTLYTLALMLQANRRSHILAPVVEGRIVGYLASARDQLARAQHADGYWTVDWAKNNPLRGGRGDVIDAVWMTGHHLDWMAIVPTDLRISEPGLVRASRFVCQQAAAHDRDTVVARCCSFFHGIRATQRLIGDIAPSPH